MERCPLPGSVLKCPKCGAPRSGSQSCPSCGIIFEKYAAKQRMLEEMEFRVQQEREQKRSGFLKLTGLAIAVLFATGIAYALYTPGEATTEKKSSPRVGNFSNPYNPYNETGTQSLLSDDAKKRMRVATFTLKNRTLRYPHNEGTALVLTHHCQAITGLAISRTKSTASSTYSSNVTSLKNNISYYEDKIEQKRQKFLSSCVDCSEERFAKTVSRENKRLDDARKRYNTAVDKLVQNYDKGETLSARINQTQQNARVDERDESLGLAMLYIENTTNCLPPPVADTDNVKVGDKVFIIGGNGRIADGVVTGFTTSNSGYRMIMHSASASTINGLAGAPLFNKNGELLGVHVPSFGTDRNAVRIEDVLDAFNLAL